jgi:ferric enterobactin receptor
MKATTEPAKLTRTTIKRHPLKILLVLAFYSIPLISIFSQNNLITADFVDVPLSEVLTGISENCGVRLAFDHDLASDIPVTLRLTDADADNALSLTLQNTPLWFIIINEVYVIKLREELPEEIVSHEPETVEIRIGGLVREAETREHLPYAGIQIEGTHRGTSANSDGFFTLITEYDDSITLIVSYIGYNPEKIVIHPADKDEFLVVEMERRSDMLEAVEIVGQPHREIIQVLTESGRLAMNASRMQEIPSLNGLDVAAPLQILPGIDGTTERASGLSIRKSEPDKNLVIYDGFPIYHIDHFFGMFTAFNSKAIKDIRVHKSVSDASLGGRTGGVIEITGKSGDMSGVSVDTGIDLLSGNFFTGLPVGRNSSVVITARRSFTDFLRTRLYHSLFNKISYDFENTGNQPPGFMEAGPDESVYYFYDYTGKYTYKPTDKDVISLSAYRGYDRMDFERRVAGSKSNEESDWGNRGSSIRWARKWSEIFYSNILAGYSDYHLYFMHSDSLSRPHITPSEYISVDRKFELDNAVSDIIFNLNNQVRVNNSNRIDFGLAYNDLNTNFADIYRYMASRSTLADTIRKETAAGSVTAFYLQNNYLNGRLGIFNIGIRLTAYRGDFYYEPRVAATYHLPGHISIKMSYAKNNQFINRILVFEEGHPRFLWALSDGKGLPVVESREFSGGLLWNPSPFLLVDAEVYSRKSTGMTAVQNRIFSTSGGSGLRMVRTYYNYSNETTGMDLLVKTGQDPLQLWLAYTYSVSTDESPIINNGTGYPSVSDQTHELKLLGVLSIEDWVVSSSFVFGSGKPWDRPLLAERLHPHPDYMKNSERLPPYHRLDLGISRTIRLGRYSLNTGINIFNLYNQSNIISRPYSLNEEPVRSVLQENSPFVFNEISGRGFAFNIFTEFRF